MISISPMSHEEGQARRKNSIVIGLVLLLLVALFYAVTLVRLQGNVAKRMSMSSGDTVREQVVAPTKTPASSSTGKVN